MRSDEVDMSSLPFEGSWDEWGKAIDPATKAIRPDHPFGRIVTMKCHGRPVPDDEKGAAKHEGNTRIPCPDSAEYETVAFLSDLTACDRCRALAEREAKYAIYRKYWEAICPSLYRKTDKNHPSFPKAQYEATRAYKGGESLFLYGPSGSGKTRLAMWLLRRCLVDHNMHVGVLWSYELQLLKQTQKGGVDPVKHWGAYQLLLIDDGLLTSATSENLATFLKNLIDHRMSHERSTIITSQVGGDDYQEQAKKYAKENTTKIDNELVGALLRRLRETFKVIAFQDLTPAPGEAAF